MKVVLELALVLLRILKEVLGLIRDIKDLRRPKAKREAEILLLISEAAVLLATFSIIIIQLNCSNSQ